jgi:hypothetical protein
MNETQLIAAITEAYEVYRRLPDPLRAQQRAKMAACLAAVRVRDLAEATVPDGRVRSQHRYRQRLTAPTGWSSRCRRTCRITLWARILWLTYGRGLTLGECSVALLHISGRGSADRKTTKRAAALSALVRSPRDTP